MKYTNKKYAVVAMLFIILNPQTGNIAMYPWKDVSFAIGALLLMTFAMHIYFSKGSWIKKPMNIVMFILVFSATTLFRHNAPLFTVPLIFAVILSISKKRAVVVVFGILIIVLGIKFPLYSIINVEKPGSRQIETLGLPMTVIGAVVAYDPDSLDEKTKEFAYKVAPKEVWESEYSYGSYNGVKSNEQTDNAVIEEYGALNVISMMISCFRNSPSTALKGLIKLTDVVYSVSDNYTYFFIPGIAENDYNIYTKGISLFQTLNYIYTGFCIVLLPHLFMYIGAMHLILIISILAKFKLNKLREWKKIFFIIPVFAYNYGTSLLLTGAGDSARFFYYTFLLMPVLLVFLYKEERRTEISVK